MNHLLFLLGAYLALANPEILNSGTNSDEQLWDKYKIEHDKNYTQSKDEIFRRFMVENKRDLVEEFNKMGAEELGFELEINHLADLTSTEYERMNGFRLPDDYHNIKYDKYFHRASDFLENLLANNDSKIPDEVDWRKEVNRVSPVKNQGACGSCWAFASTGTLEGQEKGRKMFGSDGNSLTELSEQNLVDCVKKDAGCNGGIMADALDFVKEEGGIESEDSYPYEARTRKCRFDKDKVAFTDSGFVILPQGNEDKLKEVVAKFGPVAVAIDASSLWFQLYRRGVYYHKHCKNKENQLDHAVLVVGYGTDPKKGDYWIVKNSWGSKWGENGYIRMARNRGNNCGIATMATIPTF